MSAHSRPETPQPRRGQPVLGFSLLMTGWVFGRMLLWEPLIAPQLLAKAPDTSVKNQHPTQQLAHHSSAMAPHPAFAFRPLSVEHEFPQTATLERVTLANADRAQQGLAEATVGMQPSIMLNTPTNRAALLVGQNMLWMAAVGGLPSPQMLMDQSRPLPPNPQGAPTSQKYAETQPRWSADGWLLLRPGGGDLVNAVPFASYGASQVGAVARYRLDRSSEHRPSAYLRATAALNGAAEHDLALGLSVRPLAKVPLVAMAEGRLSRLGLGTGLRPAAMIVSEIPPISLPLGSRAAVYVQAGYVGGPGATGFVDGMMRLDWQLNKADPTPVRAGIGVWGGAQNGAARLDLGPSASVVLGSSTARARLAVDYRVRVAGNAKSQSGPALTLSAGF